jgi:hypothetical protein
MMKNRIPWIVIGLLLLIIFILSMMRTPAAITSMLANASTEAKNYSAFIHIVFLIVVVLAIFIKKLRTSLFSLFTAFLSLSATIIAVRYGILPNIIVFGMFFVLIIHGYLTKNLNFDLEHIAPINFIFGIAGLLFGFWYLHWVESPVWLNAMLYSPLGVVNCPTMATICGFLCLARKPRSAILEMTVALATLYFGFFGLFRLGAYVDIILIICALFLLVRIGSYLAYEGTFEKQSG